MSVEELVESDEAAFKRLKTIATRAQEGARRGSKCWRLAQQVIHEIDAIVGVEADSGTPKPAVIRMAELIADFATGSEDCSYDHHGYCQTHMWFDTDPACPYLRAKEFMRR